MQVLVTGGAGFIGSHIAQSLAQAGIEPVVLDDLRTGQRDAVRWGPFVLGNVGDRAIVRRLLRDYRIEGVIHLAASAYVGESVSAPRRYFQNNVTNGLALLDELLDAGVFRVVFSSTCATYGIPSKLPVSEDHPQRPVNPYGESKLFLEHVFRSYDDAYGMRQVSLRYFNAAGADPGGELGEDHEPETHLIPLVIDAALGRRPAIEIFGTDYPTPDGTAVRDYIHVSDLADAHIRALSWLMEGRKSLTANLGTGNGHSVREVIAAVERVGGRAVPVAEMPRRTGDPPVLVADAARAQRVLGWQPVHTDLDEIVRTAWDWRVRRSRVPTPAWPVTIAHG